MSTSSKRAQLKLKNCSPACDSNKQLQDSSIVHPALEMNISPTYKVRSRIRMPIYIFMCAVATFLFLFLKFLSV